MAATQASAAAEGFTGADAREGDRGAEGEADREGRRRRRRGRGGRDRDQAGAGQEGTAEGLESAQGAEAQAAQAIGEAGPVEGRAAGAESGPVEDAQGEPSAEERDGERDGERRRGRGRDRFRRERRPEGEGGSEPIAGAEGTGEAQAFAPAAQDLAEAGISEVATAATSTPERAAAAPAVVEPFVLPMDELRGIAEGAGLQWVNSDAERVAAAQAAIAAEPAPVRVPRERKPVVLADEGPLILVETKKDLSQLKLPFEQQTTT